MQFSTRAIHSDHGIEKASDVAPPIHLSTTYERPNEDGLVYGRIENMSRRRCEQVLGDLEGGTAFLYGSGMAAAVALLYLFRPKRIFIERGYHMTHGAIRLFGEKHEEDLDTPQMVIETFPITDRGNVSFQKGDLIMLETPNNPCCEIYDIAQSKL